MSNKDIKFLYHMTHIDNLVSILKDGIYSHSRLIDKRTNFQAVYNNEIIVNRGQKNVPQTNLSLWEYSNFYFQPRNPMLYTLIRNYGIDNIIILAVNPNVMGKQNTILTNGNAASSFTTFFDSNFKSVLSQILKDVDTDWWNEEHGSKRKIMSECLIKDYVSNEYIQTIYVCNQKIKDKIEKILIANKFKTSINIAVEPHMFFAPIHKQPLTKNLSVLQGDMFFSKMQTLTISVNCVGVMGAGLASRTRYQFPDVFVYYQDLCKKKKLKTGVPNLYMREKSFDLELSDALGSIRNPNLNTWFLLFPTKQHWKEQSKLSYLDDGLRWLQDNYKRIGITSLALPALGCGLGQLEWKEAGPLMCNYLKDFDIPVNVYIPNEREPQKDFLTKDFLLKNK